MPKKWTSILFVLWLLVMAFCVVKIVYWNSVSEDAHLEWYNDGDDPKNWDVEDIYANREADTKTARWMTAGIVWGVIGLIALIWARKLNSAEPVPR